MAAGVNVYKSLVRDGLTRVQSGTEADYRAVWMAQVQPRDSDLLAMAVAGGIVADRLAWVFVAGYQAACRHVFPSATMHAWVSYATTEDPEGKLPGVSLDDSPTVATLSGHKAWIVAAKHVEQLVVRVGTDSNATYFLINRDRPGLTIEPTEGVFLAGLSQGRLSLQDTPVTEADVLDATLIGQLALVEPLYAYAAFCGFVLGGTTEHDLVACSHSCLDAVEPAIASIRAGDLDHVNLEEARAQASDLLDRLAGNRVDAAGSWETDQRIVAMYSRDMDIDIPHS